MSDDEDKREPKPAAQILSKPIHNKATRKVPALPKLIQQSERPDGAKAVKVDEGLDSEAVQEIDLDDGGLFDDVFDEDSSSPESI